MAKEPSITVPLKAIRDVRIGEDGRSVVLTLDADAGEASKAASELSAYAIAARSPINDLLIF